MRTVGVVLVLFWTLFGNNSARADPKSRRAAVEKTTRDLIAKGLITSASDTQVDVTAKLVRKPLDDQAKLVALICQEWAIVAHDEDPDGDPDAGPDDVVANASCDVTRNGANLLGRTLGDAVRWETWYLREKTR